jgi:hypothetical protein
MDCRPSGLLLSLERIVFAVVCRSRLKATYYANQLFSSFFTYIRISMTLETWNTHVHHIFNFIRKFKLRLPNHLLYEYGSFCQRIKNVCFFVTSRSYIVAFLKRYIFLHLIFSAFLPYISALAIFELSMFFLVCVPIFIKIGW